jgi:1,2-diacylglycerol 3-beta-galactosyltransferase
LENAKRISRPRASFDIAACILSFLPPTGESGVWQTEQRQRQRRLMARRLRTAVPIRALRRRLPHFSLKRRAGSIPTQRRSSRQFLNELAQRADLNRSRGKSE